MSQSRVGKTRVIAAPNKKTPVLETEAPKTGATKKGVPKIGVLKAEAPKAGVPKAGVPKAGVPKAGVPKAGVPKAVALKTVALKTQALQTQVLKKAPIRKALTRKIQAGKTQKNLPQGRIPQIRTPQVSKILRLKKPVIAVTGSAGKTTTKEIIASILQKRYPIFKSRLNMNMIFHTRQNAQMINERHRAVVLEYGMLQKGHIRRHCQVIQPNIGVITNVGTAHIGNFEGKIAGVAAAKSELIHHMNQAGTLFINADDPNSRLLSTKSFRGKIYMVGTSDRADYRASNIRYSGTGMSFEVVLNGTKQTFHVPALGKHNAYNALFAIAVAHYLGCSSTVIRSGLLSFKKPVRRLTTYRLRNGIKLLDDSYSANPNAMKAAVDVLCTIGKGTNVAVLGSMLEMGNYSVKGHKDVGRHIAWKEVDYLFTFGIGAKHIGTGAIQSGFPSARVIHCTTKPMLHQRLAKCIRPGVTFLVKGSNKMKMNETVQYLRKRVQ